MRHNILFSIILLGFTAPALAQQQGGGQPSVVQLPSVSFFTVSTTVSVPDSGRGLMGGVKSGQIGSATRGVPLLSKVPWMKRLFTNKGIGRAVNNSNVSVTARIIDLNEMEEDLMNGGIKARRVVGGVNDLSAAKRRKGFFINRNIVAKKDSETLKGSLASIRNKLRAEDLVKQREGLAFFQKAKKAEKGGKKAVAKIFYRMAAKRASLKVRRVALERLAILAAPKKPARVVAK